MGSKNKTDSSKYEGHSPEPWWTKPSKGLSGDIGIMSADGGLVAEAFADIRKAGERSSEVGPNAALLADAPTILKERDELIAEKSKWKAAMVKMGLQREALTEALEVVARWPYSDGDSDRIEDAMADAQAALAKLT